MAKFNPDLEALSILIEIAKEVLNKTGSLDDTKETKNMIKENLLPIISAKIKTIHDSTIKQATQIARAHGDELVSGNAIATEIDKTLSQ